MKKLSFLLVLLFSSFIHSQENQPKIGLVLSGGGAKGFAHIGILHEIEKAGIQLDYIGGTSMGAIIGGMYASGYSASQIEEIVKSLDFRQLLRDELPRSTTPFFEKEHGEKTKITLPISKGSIGLPKGVSKGQNILNLFYELLGSVEEINDFSKLPIPFYCIATDVENGNQILIEKGSLAKALRASASFPTILNPVEHNDRLLVDGGISNNFPVSIMKSKGIDIIIGVDVEGELFKREKLTSVISILNQIINYQMYDKSNKERKQLDVIITPEVLEYSVLDFEKNNEILERGKTKAKEYQTVFKKIAEQQTEKKIVQKPKLDNSRKVISKIYISGSKYFTRSFVLGKLNLKIGDSLNREDISKRIQLLSATKNYDKISYDLKKDGLSDGYVLDFDLKETKENASLSLGLHYDHLYKSGLLANYQRKHTLINNDLISLDVILGDNLRYNFNYFVDNGFYFSYGINSRYNHFRDNAKFNLTTQSQNIDSNVNLSYDDFTNQIFIQTAFNRKFTLGLGLEHKYLKVTTPNVLVDNKESVLDKSSYYSAFGYLKLDTYDAKYFATKGFYADLNFKYFLNSSNFNNNFERFSQVKGTIGFATTFLERLTFQFTNEAGFTFNNPTSRVFDFYLGGYNQNYINTFTSLYGYSFSSLSDKSFVKAEFNFRYRVADKHYASFIANYARLDDNVFKDIDIFKDVYSGYAIGYSYNSLVGPIELKYSWSPDVNQNYWLFNLGFWF